MKNGRREEEEKTLAYMPFSGKGLRQTPGLHLLKRQLPCDAEGLFVAIGMDSDK